MFLLLFCVNPKSFKSSLFSSAVRNVEIRKYGAIILPVVMYRYVTWCQTLLEEHRKTLFEKRVLRRIFGPKRV
jgi:hypothetical protein